MQVLKTIVTNGATILPIDTITYEGSLWLVPQWKTTPDGYLTPDSIIRIDVLTLKKLDPPQPWEYHLLDRMPDGVLDGPIPASDAKRFVVIDRPRDIVRDLSIH